MYKFVFTYLIKKDNKNWCDFIYSLNLLYRKILTKLSCKFKVLIFCEGEPSKEAYELINQLSKNNSEIKIKKIILQQYVERDTTENFKNYSTHPENFSLRYRDMCKFFAIDIFNDEELKDAKYFVRLDTDSFFLDVRKKFVESLENITEDYAFIDNTIQREDKRVALGFGNCLYEFCRLNKFSFTLPRNYLKICKDATSNPNIFYTNFEVIKINWIKTSSYKKLLVHIVNNKGIYNFRWGDALIRYYSIKLIGAKLLILKGCLYKHQILFDSRIFLLRISSKICSTLKRKLLKDNFDIYINSVDKFFLNIKEN